MRLRCPYCRHEFEGSGQSHCPGCGKFMHIPARLHPEAAGNRPRRGAGRREPREPVRAAFAPAARHVFAALFLLAGAAALLLREATPKRPRIAVDWRPGRASEEVAILRTALEHYHRDCGNYPLEKDGLFALIRDPNIWGWNGPYVTMLRPDPWGERYVYRSTNGTVRVFSAGPDARPDTPDDIEAPDPAPAADGAGDRGSVSGNP